MVNNQKDGTKRTKGQRLRFCVMSCHRYLPPLWAPQTSQHTPAECISSAIDVPKGKRGVQNRKDPLYEIRILKIPTYDQPSVTKSVSLICGSRERNARVGCWLILNQITPAPTFTLCFFKLYYVYFVDRASRYKFLEITNLTHFFSCIYLFHVSTCFQHHSAHHQEIEL
jgi:hypothetical protein